MLKTGWVQGSEKAQGARRAAVIGGGIGGLLAARVLADRMACLKGGVVANVVLNRTLGNAGGFTLDIIRPAPVMVRALPGDVPDAL